MYNLKKLRKGNKKLKLKSQLNKTRESSNIYQKFRNLNGGVL